ncbi:TnsA endonuclease N-terminal domain-containing protein [Paenibacillus paeoniae]|nr:TnsA endonuclease N-terminal domain-containing protein [Paenibacillus paeoniae]
MRYDRLSRDWQKEDATFAPKRKVNNKNSHQHPHIIGSFFSRKLERPVEYESLGERLFYYYLELEQSVIRYYVQPVEIPISKDNGESWLYVPDALVYRHQSPPFLYQVKHEPDPNEDEKLKHM